MDTPDPIRLIAFYLPQFHPIPENDRWWGPGFTEWTNVTRAAPLYSGHAQPRRPGELGYYDLRVDTVRHRQAELAKKYGVYGFCYYYYWFSGRRLLERPLEMMLADSEMDFPFCLCWANENWSRRWDGSEDELLMEQRYTAEDPESLMRDLAPVLSDRRYMTVSGAPIFLVYRPAIIRDLPNVVRTWRRTAADLGIPKLHVCGVQSFGYMNGLEDGFDAMVEFPPHSIVAGEITQHMPGLEPRFTGKIYHYPEIARAAANEPSGLRLPVYRGLMAGWDNSARRGTSAHIFHDATPAHYEAWLTRLVDYTHRNHSGDHKLIFVNAWNEWAEGTYLEPDEHYQYGYLEATSRALFGASQPDTLIRALRQIIAPSAEAGRLLDELERSIKVKDAILGLVETKGLLRPSLSRNVCTARFESRKASEIRMPAQLSNGQVFANLDVLNTPNHHLGVIVNTTHDVLVRGWVATADIDARPNSPVILLLTNLEDGAQYIAEIPWRERREDVAENLGRPHGKRRSLSSASTLYSGYRAYAVLSSVTPGSYSLDLVVPTSDRTRGFTAKLHPAVLILGDR